MNPFKKLPIDDAECLEQKVQLVRLLSFENLRTKYTFILDKVLSLRYVEFARSLFLVAPTLVVIHLLTQGLKSPYFAYVLVTFILTFFVHIFLYKFKSISHMIIQMFFYVMFLLGFYGTVGYFIFIGIDRVFGLIFGGFGGLIDYVIWAFSVVFGE